MSNETKIDAIVCPKQKLVKIVRAGVKGAKAVIKTYRFKEDIPFEEKDKAVTRYDFGAWSVSEREYETTVKVRVWDESVMQSIKQKALNFYNQNPNT